MKKKFIVPVRYVLILFLLPVGACHKFIDWKEVWHKHKPDCRIKKIISYHNPVFEDSTITADFSYNQKGDPEMVTFNAPSTGRPHLRFHYDSKGRLVGYTGPYNTGPNSFYEFYHLYQYDSRNRIIVDTTYGFGEIVNGIPQPNQRFKIYTDYEYDAHDRVSRLSIIAIVSDREVPVWDEEFVYGADGNMSIHRRIEGGIVTESHLGPYDDKINMNLTHKIWMFLQANYSRNNLIAASQYNKSQLPTRYQKPYSTLGFLYSFDISDSEIFYDCKK
jgi:hypothetical protein